jgi:hypothetical protein
MCAVCKSAEKCEHPWLATYPSRTGSSEENMTIGMVVVAAFAAVVAPH